VRVRGRRSATAPSSPAPGAPSRRARTAPLAPSWINLLERVGARVHGEPGPLVALARLRTGSAGPAFDRELHRLAESFQTVGPRLRPPPLCANVTETAT